MTHPLIDELDAIDNLVDGAAWERALNALVAFDTRLRNGPEPMRSASDDIRRQLVERHDALAFKLASLRAETAARLQQLGRGHNAAKRYLTASAA
jgi:hypothetical protein